MKFIKIIGTLDALCAISKFSFNPLKNNCCPIINSQKNLLIAKNIKHPVLSDQLEEFVGNDIEFKEKSIMVLTGPNMGGKSTIMRTVALNVILAQIGAHVIADYFEFSLIDKIFTRIGASD